MSAAMPDKLVDAFFRFYRDDEYDDAHPTTTTADLLGRHPTTFGDWSAQHAPAFA